MVTPLVDVRRKRRLLDQGLQIPETLGGNDMPAALRRMDQILRPIGRNDVPLAFVITDGNESVTAETHAAVAALPKRSVHMLLVEANRIVVCVAASDFGELEVEDRSRPVTLPKPRRTRRE